MTDAETIESRVATLETEVTRLRHRLNATPAVNWLERVTGSFEDQPEFDAVLELGRAVRQAHRPDGTASA